MRVGSVHFEIPDDEKRKKTEKKLRRVKVGKSRSLSEDSKQKDSNNEDQENKGSSQPLNLRCY